MYCHNTSIGTNKTVEFIIFICHTHFDHKIILKGTCYTRTKDTVDFILQVILQTHKLSNYIFRTYKSFEDWRMKLGSAPLDTARVSLRALHVWRSPKVRSLILLIRGVLGRIWVRSTGGIILKGETRSTRSDTCTCRASTTAILTRTVRVSSRASAVTVRLPTARTVAQPWGVIFVALC